MPDSRDGQIPYFPPLPHAVLWRQREPFSDLNCQVQLTLVAEPELEPPGTGVTVSPSPATPFLQI